MQQSLNVTGTLTANPLEPTIWLKRPPHRPGQELKPERVQEELQAMPGWTLDLSRKTINRLHEFGDSSVALAYAAFIKELAGADGQRVSILVSGGLVGLSLHGYPRKGTRGGITESVLEMAKRLG
ncbi:MAG: hypothetical protein QOF89_6010 [Acidobacteriota bacterium]|jgi:pterin-4a-carbinolamine dehydratase|nr:hypothetical protein [Acidobacteriota bacterium]